MRHWRFYKRFQWHLLNTPAKHSGVISLFDKEFVMKGIFEKELSKDFHKAFELRQSTDYKIIKPISTDKANQISQKAEKFVQAIKHYLNREITNSK